MMKRKFALHSMAGTALLSGALVLGACNHHAPVASTPSNSPNVSASSTAQQQASLVLQRVQANVAQGNIRDATAVSASTIRTGAGPINSQSKGLVVLDPTNPFGASWNTTTQYAGRTVHSAEIITQGTLYVQLSGNNSYNAYSLTNLAHGASANNVPGNIPSIPGVNVTSVATQVGVVGSALTNFLSMSDASVVCGNSSVNSNVSSASQVCTVPFSTSMLSGLTNGVPVPNATSLTANAPSLNSNMSTTVQAYEIQGLASTSQAAGASTNGAVSAKGNYSTSSNNMQNYRETLYIAADGSYQPLAVDFEAVSGGQNSSATISSTTAFLQWGHTKAQRIAPPTHVANNG